MWAYLQWGHLSPRLGHICLEWCCTTLISGIWPSCTSKTFFLSKSQVEINFIAISLSRVAKFLSSLPFSKDGPSAKYNNKEDPKLRGSYFNFPGHRTYNLIFCLFLIIKFEITGVLNLKHMPLSPLQGTLWQLMCLPLVFSPLLLPGIWRFSSFL